MKYDEIYVNRSFGASTCRTLSYSDDEIHNVTQSDSVAVRWDKVEWTGKIVGT